FSKFHGDFTDTLDDVEATIDAQLWRSAANHLDSTDLGSGADMYHVCKVMARLGTSDQGDEWALNVVVVEGGQWTRERLSEAGYE
ncbi:unnamed protein product, partial [Prorocentrum cordatum]